MAKTIKFNLICDGSPVRTIEDLQNHFSIEDVLRYYDNRLLHRWLSVRGFEEEQRKVSAITAKNQMDIIKELISIFDVSADASSVEESVYMLRYLEERKELYKCFGQKECELQNQMREYREGYDKLVKEIIARPRDIAKIKANISAMATYYSWIMELNHRELFFLFKEKNAFLPIMCLLMNEKTRGYYIPANEEEGETACRRDSRQVMFQHICKMIISTEFEVAMEEYLLTFAGNTESYWKDIEPKGKKCMIISIDAGSYIRPAGKSGGDLAYSDIHNQFMILDGIDYKSNWGKLVFMEV